MGFVYAGPKHCIMDAWLSDRVLFSDIDQAFDPVGHVLKSAALAIPLPPESIRALAPPLGTTLPVFSDNDAKADAGAAITIIAGGSQFHHPLAQFIPPLAPPLESPVIVRSLPAR
jgi:hypothetical protein